MRRQNQTLGLVVIAFSVGLLLGGCCELGFGLFLIAVGGIVLGLGLLRKK